MAQQLNKLEVKKIGEATKEILKYIDDRRKGIISSLKTRWNKFNRNSMGGIEPNTIYTIAGISGSGKSSFVNTLETDIIDLNPKEKIIVLNFNFEMLSSRQVGRKLSYKTKLTTAELYSFSKNIDDSGITDKEYEKIKSIAEKIKDYPIYYVDCPGNIDEIRNTINYYSAIAKKERAWLVIFLDHALLTKNRSGESERQTLMNLQRVFMEAKKNGRTTIIQVAQMNRDIESKERILNKTLHYPMRSDIFGSDSLYQSSDYVIVLHSPEQLGIKSYGIDNLPVTNMLYMHFLKVREGEPKILSFKNNLKYNDIQEVNPFNLKNEIHND